MVLVVKSSALEAPSSLAALVDECIRESSST